MTLPQDEFPNEVEIRRLATENLPEHIRVRSIQCIHDDGVASGLPEDWVIRIEYENHLPLSRHGTNAEIAQFQQWAFPLRDSIRSQWPPQSLRVEFLQVET